MQFTLKNPLAVHRAFELMKERGKVELIWGPLRHGAGHNIVFYFRDYTGNIVEYSAEEEIIAGPRKTLDQTTADGVGLEIERDDRNCRGQRSYSLNGRRTDRDEDVHLALHELECVQMPVKITRSAVNLLY
jgi:hypothetical protein